MRPEAGASEPEAGALSLESAFLAAMSHELRTPLATILGFTGLLLEGRSGPLNEAQRHQLESVDEAAKRLLDLVNDVLDLAKARSGLLEIGREEFDLGLSIGAVVGEAGPKAAAKGLALRVEVEEGAKRALGDRKRAEQALRHLLNNALKFTDSGSIEVAARRVASGIEVSVSDTGIGIAEEELSLLFRPFKQLDSGWARRYGGAGLGLSLAKSLVEAMGGSMAVSSKKGVGSRFGFSLPAPEGAQGPHPASH